jgi:hypothetical protein
LLIAAPFTATDQFNRIVREHEEDRRAKHDCGRANPRAMMGAMFKRRGEGAAISKLPAMSLALGTLIARTDASAAEIKVLTAGAFKSVVMAVAPDLETQSGRTAIVDNDTAGMLTRRIADGEAFDVVILAT